MSYVLFKVFHARCTEIERNVEEFQRRTFQIENKFLARLSFLGARCAAAALLTIKKKQKWGRKVCYRYRRQPTEKISSSSPVCSLEMGRKCNEKVLTISSRISRSTSMGQHQLFHASNFIQFHQSPALYNLHS